MAELVRQWDDGGNLTVVYDGDRDGSAVFSSDANEGVDREMDVTFKDISGAVAHTRTVVQEGRREPFYGSDGDFVLSDTGTFNVIKEGY